MDWDMICKEYESSAITLKALAEKYGIKLGTLKSRKSREGWSRDSTKMDATKKTKKDATSKKDATIKPIIVSDDLNDKQKLFCLYYLKYFNATKAYHKAYGVDRNTAESIAYRLMANVGVKREIDRLKAEKQHGIFLDSKAVLQKYIDIAFADITDFVQFGKIKEPEINIITGEPVLDADGEQVIKRSYNYVDFLNADEVDGTLVTEIKQGKDGISVKLADKMKALEMLSKYFDLLSENDKKKLQKEKLKTEIAKTKAEVDNITSGDDDQPIEIMIKRKER